MQYTPAFAVFALDESGPLWKGFFDVLESAKLQATTLAVAEGCEYFVFDLASSTEVFRVSPDKLEN